MASKKGLTEALNNPALGFLSEPEEAKAEQDQNLTEPQQDRLRRYAEELQKAGYQFKQAGKTRRCQIVMTESLYAAAREHISKMIDPITNRPLSFNQYVSNLIQADIDNATQEQ